MKRWLDDFLYDLEQELRTLGRALVNPHTWIVTGVLILFGILIYFGMRIALRYDSLMFFLGADISLCRTLANHQYAGLIYLLFFFAIAIVYCLGSLMNYLSERNRGKYAYNTRRLAIHTLLGGVAALLIGALATGILHYWC
jgi:uncharacterized membrane protein